MFDLSPEVAQRIAALETLPRLETETRERFRRHADGSYNPSATTVTSAYPKWNLVDWSARVEREMVCGEAGKLFGEVNGQKIRGSSFAELLQVRLPDDYAYETVRDVACNTGNEAHALIDWTVNRELGDTFTPEPRAGDPARIAFREWVKWRNEHRFTSLAVERDVKNEQHKYNGRVDWIGHDDQGLVIADWKTGRDIYPEAHLQVASYIVALRSMGIPVRTGYIVKLPKLESDPVWRVAEVGHMAAGRVYTVEELFPVFLALWEIWAWSHHMKKPAVGRASKKAAPRVSATENGRSAAGPGVKECGTPRVTDGAPAARGKEVAK